MLGQLKLLQPTTISEACGALEDYGERAKVYAGGAELLLLLRNRLLETEVLVDVKKIERLQRTALNDGVLRIGACVTHHALENNQTVREHAPAFAYAESQVANIRVRNQGTLGGNLAFNDPHSDPGTVLLIHNAAAIIGGKPGERRIGLDQFFVDTYATVLAPSELLLEIEVPVLPKEMGSAYLRLHRCQRPTLGVAAAVRITHETVDDVRLAVGCVGAKPERLTDLERKILGAKLNEARLVLAAEKKYLRELLRPVDDLLGSAEYKLYMTGVMLGDALVQAAETIMQ
jgi:carbon-monoxide dehydrogenase medium subunit